MSSGGSISVFVLPGEVITAVFEAENLPVGPLLGFQTEAAAATAVFAENSWPFVEAYPTGGVITLPANKDTYYTMSDAASGTFSFEVTCGGKTATGKITVNNPLQLIRVDPATATLAVGGQEAFTAIAVYSSGGTAGLDNNSSVTWSSSDTTIATMAVGLATGVAAGGPVTISVRYAGVTGTASLTVAS